MYDNIDILGRENFCDKILDVVEKLSEKKKSSTFAIEGQWGIGKTFLLDILERKIEDIQSENTANDKYMVFHYNCWQYDYYEEPSIAIIASMIEKIKKEESLLGTETDKFINAGWGKAKEIMGNISGEFIKNKIGINIVEVFKDISNISEQTEKNNMAFDKLFEFRQTLDNTRTKLAELSKDKTIIFIVDELDRCMPFYMIKVLERLHHILSGIDNITVILAIDSKQLEESVLQIYGNSTNVGNYLKKFIDFTFVLDQGKIVREFEIKYKSYFDKFDNSNEKDIERFQEFFSEIFILVDIRTQEKLIYKAETIHDLINEFEKPDIALLGFELMWVLFSYKSNQRNLIWIPDINKATYSGLDEKIGKKAVKYLQSIEKSVGGETIVDATGKKYHSINNRFIDKVFWMFSAIYYDIDKNSNTCNHYINKNNISLKGEEEISKKFYEMALIMK